MRPGLFLVLEGERAVVRSLFFLFDLPQLRLEHCPIHEHHPVALGVVAQPKGDEIVTDPLPAFDGLDQVELPDRQFTRFRFWLDRSGC
jgi:hypothetical protein